jgi:hypothetical protein
MSINAEAPIYISEHITVFLLMKVLITQSVKLTKANANNFNSRG